MVWGQILYKIICCIRMQKKVLNFMLPLGFVVGWLETVVQKMKDFNSNRENWVQLSSLPQMSKNLSLLVIKIQFVTKPRTFR